jgi:NAD(P)H-hydrate repair Nnr-like enzyme with NAD(P)H-hydrate epimerase domain
VDSVVARQIDETLMQTPGFSIDQLMELAGLSVACACFEYHKRERGKKVLILAGPGNNGGDGEFKIGG